MTRSIILSNTPQAITTKAAFLESQGGNFYYAFSETMPEPTQPCHVAQKLYSPGTFGQLYAWTYVGSNVTLVISEAVE